MGILVHVLLEQCSQEERNGGAGEGGDKELSKDGASGSSSHPLIPQGALECLLHHRAGPTWRPGGQTFVCRVSRCVG